MPRLRCHGNADRMAIALSFPFCPCEIKPLCYTLPGRPPRIGTQGCWGRRMCSDQSICMSSSDSCTRPAEIRPVIGTAGNKIQGGLGRAAATRINVRTWSVHTGGQKSSWGEGGWRGREKKKNILNNKPEGRYQYADNNPDGGGTEAPLPRGVSTGQIRQVMSSELSQSGEILNSP